MTIYKIHWFRKYNRITLNYKFIKQLTKINDLKLKKLKQTKFVTKLIIQIKMKCARLCFILILIIKLLNIETYNFQQQNDPYFRQIQPIEIVQSQPRGIVMSSMSEKLYTEDSGLQIPLLLDDDVTLSKEFRIPRTKIFGITRTLAEGEKLLLTSKFKLKTSQKQSSLASRTKTLADFQREDKIKREEEFKKSFEYQIQQEYKEFLKSNDYKEVIKNQERVKLPRRSQTLENLKRQAILNLEQEYKQFEKYREKQYKPDQNSVLEKYLLKQKQLNQYKIVID
jgi:hypothetical protein